MASIFLPDDVVKRLQEVAQRENRPVEEIVADMIEQYTPQPTESEPVEKAPNWDLILGIGNEDVTDMSTTVRETLQKYFQEKYGDTD